MRHDGAFGELLALLHEVALEDDDVLVARDEMLLLGAGLRRRVTMTLRLPRTRAADFDDAVDLGDFAGVLRLAGFEEFGHTRQTAGDVLGLRDLARRLGEQWRRPRSCSFSSTATCAPAGME